MPNTICLTCWHYRCNSGSFAYMKCSLKKLTFGMSTDIAAGKVMPECVALPSTCRERLNIS